MFAEARAAWQRTASRCFVQEDTKRAPKMACCSSAHPSAKQTDTEITDNNGCNDSSHTCPMHFSQNPSFSSISPVSRWWLQQRPSCEYQRPLMDGNFNYLKADKEVCHVCNSSYILIGTEDDIDMVDQNKSLIASTCESNDFTVQEDEWISVHTKNCQNHHTLEGEVVEKKRNECLDSCEIFSCPIEHYLHSDSSWIAREKNVPWWRSSDAEELAILVAQSPHILVQNCDLPTPQNKCAPKARNVYTRGISHDGMCPSLDLKLNADNRHHFNAHDTRLRRLTVESPCQKLCTASKGQRVSGVDKSSSPTQIFYDGSRRAQLLKALRHSQTRAREAEKAAEQATAEKEHVLKLILRQASQIFAYRQWLQLVQLENIYLRFKSDKSPPQSTFPVTLPLIPPRTGEMGKRNPSCKKRSSRCLPQYDPSNYAVILALGLSFVGAGLLLGWTFGWLLLA